MIGVATRWARPALVGFACAGAAACLPPVLEITGGSEAQRDALRDELDLVLGASSFSPDIRRVRLEPGLDGYGRYQGLRGEIELDAGLEPTFLREVLRHEVCHALDHQLPYRSFRREVYGVVAAGVAGARARRRLEAFAELCQAGPAALVLAQRCGPGAAEDELSALRSELFDRVQPPPPLRLDGEVRVTLAADAALAGPPFSTDDGLVVLPLLVDGERVPHVYTLDGQPVASEVPVGAPVQLGAPMGPTAAGLPRWSVQGERSLDMGAVRAVVGRLRFPSGDTASRMLLIGPQADRRGLAPVLATRCASPGTSFLPTRDGLWLAVADGAQVRWGPIDIDALVAAGEQAACRTCEAAP